MIVNSGGVSEGEEIDFKDPNFFEIEDLPDDEDDDEEDEEEAPKKAKVAPKDKTKNKTVKYGKVAKAIGQMTSSGATVRPPDINYSSYTFKPDPKTNSVLYGLKGITRISDDLVDSLIANRPYYSIEEITLKNKLNILQMVNLIKSGALDSFGDSREEVIRYYFRTVCDQKKSLGLRNIPMLIEHNLLGDIPKEVELFKFNNYLKTRKDGFYFVLDSEGYEFYSRRWNIDDLDTYSGSKFEPNEDGTPLLIIPQPVWDKIYKKEIGAARNYIQENQSFLLNKINDCFIEEIYQKYCQGPISRWEMESISYYYHPHELEAVDDSEYGFIDFFKMPEEPEVKSIKTSRNGRQFIQYRLYRIIGTVLEKDKLKQTVHILTKTGVVPVRIWKDQYAIYDKQISKKLENGRKKIVDRSWFKRGNQLVICGYRRDDSFIPSLNSNYPWKRQFELITKINEDGTIETRKDRVEIDV